MEKSITCSPSELEYKQLLRDTRGRFGAGPKMHPGGKYQWFVRPGAQIFLFNIRFSIFSNLAALLIDL
jgi:hypothetical protein